MAFFRVEKRMRGSSVWIKGTGSNDENNAIRLADSELRQSNVESVRVKDERGNTVYSNSN